ncbi:putative ethanolamine phosphotransferase [Trypanosoma grayi]|uniref:putative ethanolamine phosphotransferase n=1 Tax=Trypanosoma grayi TaxID=71804 RepID=UPI0004F47A2D|nr:putative ethanolamine phosphotransferase [Trypanosoma grayi]KEG15174.1 putative ethanolamine phosphotransferase [Trypanosoma grayi]
MPGLDFLISVPPSDNRPRVPPQESYLSEYVLAPVYDRIVLFYPTWWMPNKVTLVGIFSTLLASLLLLTAMPPSTVFEPPFATVVPASLLLDRDEKWRDAAGPSPLCLTMLQPLFSSVFSSPILMLFVCGLLNAIYCITDNTDGRLARRLGKASFIGEYLDHGLDCVTSLISTSVTMSILGLSFSNIGVTVMFLAFTTVLSHTLHYEENIFVWGNRYVSVDEAMLFFCAANWVPILLPDFATVKVPQALLYALLPEAWAQLLLPVRLVEVLMIVYWLSHVQVTLGIAFKSCRMLFRLTSLALCFNAFLLLAIVPYHTAHIAAHGTAGYAWGPFSYVAVWIITMACTSSIVVHILIYARCAKLQRVDPVALAGLVFVWLIFPTCPVGGMVLSVIWHITQIVINVRHLEGIGHTAAEKSKTS